MRIKTIGLDADDTLWHNERFYQQTEARYTDILAEFVDRDKLTDQLLKAERRNIGHYGFGIKGFMLSMIETAVEITGGRVPGPAIGQIIALGQEMLAHPVELLPEVEETIDTLGRRHHLVMITKGDLLDQERKLAQSGLAARFNGIEIVSAKTPQIYAQIFARHGDGPGSALMAGNSMASDVLPALEAGSWAVFVPHGKEWALEAADPPRDHPRYRRVGALSELPKLIKMIEEG